MTERSNRRRAGRRAAAGVLALAAGLGLASGCAFGEFRPEDPFRRQYSLEDAHRDYTNNVRWSKFGEASKYVDPELRDEFLERAPRFQDFRFTDWEGTPVVLDEEKRASTIRVTYTGYRMSTLIETPVEEVQEWYREGEMNEWRVRPSFQSAELGLTTAAKGQ
jgi:hypothetical protein